MQAEDALKMVDQLYSELSNRKTQAAQELSYFRGDQPLRFASEKWREFHAERYVRFCDNWCAPVANTPNERLRSTGFRLDESAVRSDDEKLLWNDWLANDMEAQSSQGWLHGLITSRSFVIVWGDRDGVPIDTWETSDQVIVGYDPEFPSQRVAALKTWCDNTTEYATLYTATEVWKYQRKYTETAEYRGEKITVPAGSVADGFFNRQTSSGLYVSGGAMGQWQQRQPAGDDTWPIKNPIGVVPVVEMPNRPMLGGDPLSEISGTRAMQDAINLLWAYLFNAADSASFPARVVMGQEPPKIPVLDANGQKVGEKLLDLKKLSEDRILWLTGQNTKIDSWDPAKLDIFTGVIETAVAHVAAQTRTPPNLMLLGKGMVNVGPDGIKAAALGQVNKVQEMHLFLSPPVREVHRLNAMVRDNKGLAGKCRSGTVQWKDAENHSEAQLVDALQKLSAIGFPFEWVAERYGLSQTELGRVLEMRKTELEADPVKAIARQLAVPGTGNDGT